VTLASTSLPNAIFRVARSPVWGWPDWAYAGSDGTFNNRYDDPGSLYRVLYASRSAYGCYLETLARFRPDLALYAELHEIEGDGDTVEPGIVPWAWRKERRVGMARASGTYADVLAAESIAYFRRTLAREVLDLQMSDLDAASLQMSVPRSLTQRVSLLAFDAGFDGVYYHSKYGNDVENYAIFEGRVFFEDEIESTIRSDDEELARALATHRLVLERSAEPIRQTLRGVSRTKQP
jgi:hypothetical protein